MIFSNPLMTAIFLPIGLLYLLMLLRIFERTLTRGRDFASPLVFFSVRDAALVTMALDVSALIGAITPDMADAHLRLQLFIPAGLLALHISIYALTLRREAAFDPERPRFRASSVLLNAYFAFTLLMTNSETVMQFVSTIGRIQ